MSSSLYNERCKVLFILSTVVILLSTIKTGSATVLMDLPLNISSKSAYINATLTDIDGTNQYFIQEWISASDASIRGGIVISGEKDSYNIYYNTDYYIREFRLVIHGTDCTSLSYQNNVFQTLPGIDKPVTNLLLLMGPSILYRLGHSSLVWKSVEDKNIRGTMMKGVTTEINGRLNITYYYKKHFDDDYGIKHPSRIEFSGCDPYSSSLLNKENLILDIYLQNENDYDQLASEVHPLPGIGCSGYLSKQIQVPKLKTDYVHYTMYEYIQGSNTSRTFSEIHASEKHKLLRLKSTLLGVTTESIYDHNLGVSYLFQENGSCSILPADLNSPGIKSTGFDWESLFFFDSYFSYIGKLNLEHRSGHPLDVWESVRYPRVTGKKVVITHYYAKSQDSEIFYDHYTLVSTKITNYQYDSSMKTYNLTDAITRDYMNFDKAGSEDELHDEFTLKGCKDLISNKTLTLSFKLQPEGDIRTAERQTESRFYELERPFLFNIILSENISPLRINTVQYNFNGTQIEMEVTFLDKPNFQYIFNSKTMPVSAVAFENMEVRIKANDEYECLDKLSKMNDHIEAIIYRPSDSTCGYLKVDYYLEEDIEESKEPCIVYHFPLRNFDRINQELPLNQIYNTLLKKVDQLYPLITESDDFFIRFQFYKLIDVVHKTKNQDDHFQSNIRVDAKLKSNDQVTVTAPDAKTLADCYRTCLNSEQLKCNIFSFCQNGDCRVSSLFTEDSDNDTHVEQDKACAIYTLNVLND